MSIRGIIEKRSGTTAGIALGLLALAIAIWTLVADGGTDAGAGRSDTAQTMEGMPGMEPDAEAGIVRMSPEQLLEFGVTYGVVERREMSEPIRAAGIVTVDETRVAVLASRFDGYVEQLHIDFAGQAVRAGQPMLDIYSPELVAAQEELLLAVRLEREGRTSVPGVPAQSSDLVAAARQRLSFSNVSDPQIDRILAAGHASRTLPLLAPATGVVVEKNVVNGQSVMAGQTLYRIADLSEVWVEAELREAEAGMVRAGTSATVELAAFPGRLIHGTVEYVYPTLQPEARTLRARVALPNPEGRLRPGMYATVRLETPSSAVLTVPTNAVLTTGEQTVVFVALGDGRFAPHAIEAGRVSGGLTEVLAGVEEGQRVVTSAQYLLDSESNLAEVMKAMMAQMPAPTAPPSDDMSGMDMSDGMEGMDMGDEE